jgi:hypothetical protein
LKASQCASVYETFQLAFWLCNVVTLHFLPCVVCAQSLNDPTLRITELVAGLSQPTAMAFIGSNDLLGAAKSRRARAARHKWSVADRRSFSANVDSASERGLLGIAVHPDFPVTPLIYLYFTKSSAAPDTSGCSLKRIFVR